MKRIVLLLVTALTLPSRLEAQGLRPPAVPLVAHDPYFSVWSVSDSLTDEQTRHWTGTAQSLYSAVRVDGKVYRIMGREVRGPQTPALEQQSLNVLPTRTIYTFSGAGISLTLTFLTPSFPDDLDVLSRPATYLTWDLASADGSGHDVSLYFDASSELAVNTADQPVTWGRFRLGDATALRLGSTAQPVLEKFGDDLRIDWGYLYAVAPQPDASTFAGDRDAARASFVETGTLPDSDDFSAPRAAGRRGAVLAFAWDVKGVSSQPVSRYLMLAYDDLYSIEYFKRRARPWWRRNGAEAGDLLRDALGDYDRLSATAAGLRRGADGRPEAGRRRAVRPARGAGLSAGAGRAQAGGRLDGTPLCFSKENFSNGCIAHRRRDLPERARSSCCSARRC